MARQIAGQPCRSSFEQLKPATGQLAGIDPRVYHICTSVAKLGDERAARRVAVVERDHAAAGKAAVKLGQGDHRDVADVATVGDENSSRLGAVARVPEKREATPAFPG